MSRGAKSADRPVSIDRGVHGGAAWPPLNCGGKLLDLSTPRVMGVLNITPDSFSDGGDFFSRKAAIARAWSMVEEGAAIVDVGGESSRPGAAEVTVAEELRRVLPVIETLARELPVPVSLDSTKPEVMRAAAGAGAGLINDIMALQRPGALAAAVETGLPICLVHMQGTPRTMQMNPRYDDAVEDIHRFFAARILACEAAGIAPEQLIIDPGFGFGKRTQDNLRLLRALDRFCDLGLPVLVGFSRKSFLGDLTKRAVSERLASGLVAGVIAVLKGARIIRTHDVAATVDALQIVEQVHCQG
ncbi:MAG: dihydropteroate synthase [Nitrococcus mobilis]|nr:dihydropteroate synthase [Nitrococcus mobilis]